MKAFKTVLVIKSIAAALVAGAGVAAPTLSHASPDDGMVCRPGYAAQFSSTTMKCTKPAVKFVALECTNALFPIKRIRVAGIPGDATNGRDVCLRNNGVALSSNDPLTGLTAGQDFVFVAINPIKAVAAREATERNEETALGLGTDGVDSTSASTLVINGGVGAEDNVRVNITLFTFPVPALGINLSPIQLDRPAIDLPSLVRTLP
jgi:hypothetical protein